MSYWTKRSKINAFVAEQIADLTRDDVDETTLPVEVYDVVLPSVVDDKGINCDDEIEGSVLNVCAIDDDWLDNEDDDRSSDECDGSMLHDDSADIVDRLRTWAVVRSVKDNVLSELLTILRSRIPELPKDARTLKKSANIDTQSCTQEVSGGLYYHFGISEGITHELQANNVDDVTDAISVQINIDGIPLFKSSNGQFWPILGKLVHPSVGSPFVIGIFYGHSKPSDLKFLNTFVEEFLTIKDQGMTYNGHTVCCHISAFICDSPARSFIKNVKGHTAYSSCERCVQSGVWDGKMTFPEVSAQKRTDIAFDEMCDEEHHKGISPITSLGVGMVSEFVLDYMHLICLGVMRRLIWLWLSGPVRGLFRLKAKTVLQISDHLLHLRSFIPCEFARKPRSLLEWQRWKATEFRQFLLYTGPVVLCGKVPDIVYKNFMLLYAGIFILLDPHLSGSSSYVDYAEQLLVLFVKHYSEVYGSDMLVFNVHNVIHLPDDARKYGCLDNVSGFCFESYLGKLKKLVRKPSKPLEQVVRRLLEQKQIVIQKSNDDCSFLVSSSDEHYNGLVPCEVRSSYRQYKRIAVSGMYISMDVGNNCIGVDDDVILLRNILVVNGEALLVFQKFLNCVSFFTYPLDSSLLGIYLVSDLTTEVFSRKLVATHLQRKYMMLPHNDRHVVIPILHT